jgi:hypothetical protein
MEQQQNIPDERRDVRVPGPAPDGFFPPQALALAVSDDGQTIVGGSGTYPVRKAVIWTNGGSNMQLLSDYAAARGIALPAGITGLISGNAISADGLTIGGFGTGATNYRSYILDLHNDTHPFAQLVATGHVDFNNLTRGSLAGVPAGSPVRMTFVISPNGTVIAPGQDTAYPVSLASFLLRAKGPSSVVYETLASTANGVNVQITNDYPKSDGIHLFSTPTHSNQVFEFELFNPGGNMFDSTNLNGINRTFGPEFFEKIAWDIQDGNRSLSISLDSVSINDANISASGGH